MSNLKIQNAHLAVGSWSKNGNTHFWALQMPQKVLALNRDKIQTAGLAFNLYMRLLAATEARSEQCSCWRESAQQSEPTCVQCYGMRWQPGYLKFGHRTTFYASTHTDLTVSNLVLNQDSTPYRLVLQNGHLSGTIITPIYRVPDSNFGNWTYKLDAYARSNTNTVVGEFSLDKGLTWRNISLLGTPGNNPTLSDFIQFKVTMTRASLSDKSPMFDCLRARFPKIPTFGTGFNRSQTGTRYDANPGEILILKTWDVLKYAREANGLEAQSQGEQYWTLPLNFFDETLTPDSSSTILTQDHFLEEARGPLVGTRYVSVQHSYSRTFGQFTHQAFSLRRLIGEANNSLLGESLSRVW
jgi:hypothetical protein